MKPFSQPVFHSSLGDKGPKSAAQTNPNPEKSNQQTLAKTHYHGAFKLMSLQNGHLFGDDDVVASRDQGMVVSRARLATATCMSHTGFVFKISGHEFLKRIEMSDETNLVFNRQLYAKQKH